MLSGVFCVVGVERWVFCGVLNSGCCVVGVELWVLCSEC